MTTIILHGHPLSGNTHKARLLLSALRIPYDERLVDVTTGAQKTPAFLALNPRGQVPVLVDGATTIFDAQAILVYLARKYDKSHEWLPDDRSSDDHHHALAANIVGWLSFAANEIQNSVQLARLHFLLGVPVSLEQVHASSKATLAILDARLQGRAFLETTDHPTIADLACFPCVGLAPEGKVDLAPYGNVRAWIDRIRQLPFYVSMPGLEAIPR